VLLLGQIVLRSIQIDSLNFDRRQLTTIVQFDLALQGGIARNLPNGFDWVLELHPLNYVSFFDHGQHQRRRADLQIGHELRHIGIPDDDMEPPVAFRIGMRFVSGIDDAARGGRRGGSLLVNVLRALRDEVLRFARYLQNLPRSAIDLPRDEEGNELLCDFPKIDVAAHEEVFMAPVGIAERVRIVLENVDFSGETFFSQSFFSRRQAGFKQSLTGFIVYDEIENVVTLGVEYSGWQPVS